MKFAFLLPAGGMLALICAGCAPGPARISEPVGPVQQSSGAMPSGDPSERLDEERLAEATKGLAIAGGLVTTAVPSQADVRTGERLRLQAVRVTDEHNTWFLSVGAYRDAILADPTNAKSYEGLAKSLLMEGRTGYAKAALASAIKLDSKFSLARYELGMVHQMESEYAGAVEEWRSLAKIDPGFRDVYSRMAIASYYTQDYSSAWRYLGEADRRREDVPPQFRGLLKEADPQP